MLNRTNLFFQVVRARHLPEAGHHLPGEQPVRVHLRAHVGRKDGGRRVRHRAVAEAHDENDLHVAHQSFVESKIPRLQGKF